ncbi:MAG: DUF1080 domain-containing protein [Thermoguttaceae bacterium]
MPSTISRPRVRLFASLVVLTAAVVSFAPAQEWVSGIPWPTPPTVDPGPVGGPPSDALVLLGDGRDLSQWERADQWQRHDGYITVAGDPLNATKRAFGDCQLHVEWAAPAEIQGAGQQRGNSGIYLMGRYEVQILDSYNNPTYPDGQAGAIYKQNPPLVNASRKPGEWQTYDIVFEAPRFAADGKLLRPALITVLHNGVLVQNHRPIQGETSFFEPPRYRAHPAKLPLAIQFHNNPVRFRNIWIRELPPSDAPPPKK